MASFKKGQLVTFIGNWDTSGTVQIANLVVYSCGKKQMVLVNEAGEKFSGCFFKPDGEMSYCSRVVPRMTKEAAEAAALEMAALIIEKQLAHFNLRIKQYSTDAGFVKCMHENIARLHSPEVIWRE